MKISFVVVTAILGAGFLQIQSQPDTFNNTDQPILRIPTSHELNFRDFPTRSFYESSNNWQNIIDSTWGPGLPLSQKQDIFNTYANILHDQFDGFMSLGMSWLEWESLRQNYYQQITDSTSRGAFSAIMSHLSHRLRDVHTTAVDTIIWATPLNPGTPILVLSGFVTVEHFGAILTTLPDSTLLVLRVVPNHPLGLQPGDIILGYDGVPWKILIQQLLEAGLPLLDGMSIGAETANLDFHMLGAGMNWHLFNTIDVIQFSTGNTLHLPVAPLINLNLPYMLNNEQLEVPGIPFPNFFNGQIVSYGILPSTNIGYIYLYQEWPENVADEQFGQAITALKNTEGLIIDMRLNFGGYALFDEAFNILFNNYHLTTDLAVRTGPSTQTLRPVYATEEFRIDADKRSMYDHPIAVLLGPTCVSMGDITAHRFSYHPTVRFFGKAPGASLGANNIIDSYPGFFLRYSLSDQYHFNAPNQYLNRYEFPIDFPVWHNPQDVANGIDAVVEEARNWIDNLVYAHELNLDSRYYSPQGDSLHLEAVVENPNMNDISAMVYVTNPDSSFRDTVYLARSPSASLSEIWRGACSAPPLEDYFSLSVSAYDSSVHEEFMIRDILRFSTVGPLVMENLTEVNRQIYGNYILIDYQVSLRNMSATTTADDLFVNFTSQDTFVINIFNNHQSPVNIPAGQSIVCPQNIRLTFKEPPQQHELQLLADIASDGRYYWQDSISALVGVTPFSRTLPNRYALYQNYPNPFNPSTTIEFDLPKTSQVTLKIFNILGEEVTTLVSDRLSAGSYSFDWDASSLASGVYLYRLQAEGFVETKKMILMR